MVSENTRRYAEVEREIERVLMEENGQEIPPSRRKYLSSLYESSEMLNPEIEL